VRARVQSWTRSCPWGWRATVVGAIGVVFTACASPSSPTRVYFQHGPYIDAVVVRTDAEMQRGLQGQRVAHGQGMVFEFSEPTHQAFWMRGVGQALDIAWWDGMGRVVGKTTMPTCVRECPTYVPAVEYVGALEAPAGDLATVAVGDRVGF
jgi:uncharacterized membrane protein (UPF0127 family)